MLSSKEKPDSYGKAITGEKVIEENKRKSGGLVSGLYYAQVK